ncbi:MAG: exosome complex protein Rrp42 [Euryarchaeota archaeon]|nr:exosome complex protein Rrp42 [Euryarchaeota archaeon]
MADIIAEIKKDYIYSLAEKDMRVDGRSLDQYRPISLETGKMGRAQGSAIVKIGNTQVIVGTKLEIGEPFPDTPNEGVLTVNAELVPLASPTFEPGPPDENAIELARVVDRGIRESDAIKLDNLCLIEGEKVWVTFVDIHVIDHDGNLIDASALGAISALLNTRLPATKVEGKEIVIEEGETVPLPVVQKPVACTFAKINGKLMLDPSLDEEHIMETRVTVTTDADGNIRAMQKGIAGYLTKEELIKAVQIARERSQELRKFL